MSAREIQLELRRWYDMFAEAERIDAKYGMHLPGDSALAVVLNSLNEAAHAGDPEFDSRVAEYSSGMRAADLGQQETEKP